MKTHNDLGTFQTGPPLVVDMLHCEGGVPKFLEHNKVIYYGEFIFKEDGKRIHGLTYFQVIPQVFDELIKSSEKLFINPLDTLIFDKNGIKLN